MVQRILNNILILIVVLYSLFPILITFIYSFLPNKSISQGKFSGWTLGNYLYILSDPNILHYVYNSVVVSSISATITTFLGFILAYSVVRKKLPFSNILENIFLLLNTFLVLGVLIIVPIFEIIVKMGVYNTLVGLIIVYTSLGFVFSFILLSRFISNLKKDYEEAGIVEGMNNLQIMFLIVLPMIKQAFISVWILQFIGFWNEFIFALTLTNESVKRTLTVGITLISGSDMFEIPWGMIMAGVFISIFPLIIIVSFLEEYLVKGISGK
ncbi:MAG: carbohydrate ABC transporter permease [Candidatus Calescibacterium sp.]|nr:carbohydrate ABC transporter permease [Candidatus Calescibacterium sp.]MDW8132423.1 carbohydrate ABC transporter permease [Candidatus Calescibacterium sp.]